MPIPVGNRFIFSPLFLHLQIYKKKYIIDGNGIIRKMKLGKRMKILVMILLVAEMKGLGVIPIKTT